jgi:DNA-binding NtrC family response regulator
MSEKPNLVSIVEMGGYPDFSPLYRQAGFEPLTERNMRKALGLIKKKKPRVVVAEFNYQSDFRDRTSSLETLMAVIQRMPDTRVIVFYEREQALPYERVTSRFPIHASLTFPVDEQALQRALAEIEETA